MEHVLPARWQSIAAYVRQQEAAGVRIGVALRAPDGERFDYRADERFLAASTIKVPVVIALLRRVDRGELTLDSMHTVIWRDVYLGDGHGGKLEFSKGVELSLRDLMYFAICMSDNNATNTLIDLAGIDPVNDTMVELGMGHSQLGRHLRGYQALPEEGLPNNWTTPHDLCILFEAIRDGKAASRIGTEKLIDMLIWQENVDRIGFHYMDKQFQWGSKTGTVHADSHDVAFVRGPMGEMILAVCTVGYPTWQEAEPPIAEIGRLAGVACGLLPAEKLSF
ncbi:MAG TPA: serine hydrolase [Thermomicrobiales bacterium]|nr:serine hydrolase [Thermomicrobiales bacterium]